MHHGTCVTHVPWCMSGSLTCGDGENVPGIPGACALAILRIWQEAHSTAVNVWLIKQFYKPLVIHAELPSKPSLKCTGVILTSAVNWTPRGAIRNLLIVSLFDPIYFMIHTKSNMQWIAEHHSHDLKTYITANHLTIFSNSIYCSSTP